MKFAFAKKQIKNKKVVQKVALYKIALYFYRLKNEA